MSGKTDRMIRKSANALRRDKESVAKDVVVELMNSPFRYRLAFAFRILFPGKMKNG